MSIIPQSAARTLREVRCLQACEGIRDDELSSMPSGALVKVIGMLKFAETYNDRLAKQCLRLLRKESP